MKQYIGKCLIALACGIQFLVLGSLPYIIYIWMKFGLFDERISWIPFWFFATLISLFILRIGFMLKERK